MPGPPREHRGYLRRAGALRPGGAAGGLGDVRQALRKGAELCRTKVTQP